jgi:hypothetical protein
MGFNLTNDGTSGSIIDGTLFSYTYDEQATSIHPLSIDGGSGSVSFSAIGTSDNMSGSSYVNSLLLINNDMTLTDDDRGSVKFKVKTASINNSDVVNGSGQTRQNSLNVIRRADPYSGNLAAALYYYAGLGGAYTGMPLYYDDGLSTSLGSISVAFLGWEDNVWNKMKELCSVTYVTVSGVKRNIELYVTNNELHVRLANKTTLNFENIYSKSLSVDSNKNAQSIEFNLYETENGVDKVFYEFSNVDGSLPKKERFKSTIASSMQVSAGETVRQPYKINATLNSVKQPVLVEAIGEEFNDKPAGQPYAGTRGEYVIMADDGLPVKPQQWLDAGGSLTVSLLNEDGEKLPPGEVEIVLVGPRPNKTGRFDPKTGEEIPTESYAVGVEDIYPAIWIVGTGTFYETKKIKIASGASNEYTAEETLTSIDNIFINTVDTAYRAGIKAAQAACGPDLTLNIGASDLVDFGAAIGGMITEGSNRFRVTSANYTPEGLTVNAAAGIVTFSEFDTIWSGKTFADFDGTLKFNEFSVIPLMEAN